MKKCSKCSYTKPFSDFGISKSNKDGLMGLCKKCNVAKVRAYVEANKEKVRAYHASRRLVKKDELSAASKKRRQANIEAARQADRERYARDRESIRDRQKAYYYQNREKALEHSREWRESNPERCKEFMAVYYVENRDKIREKQSDYYQRNKERFLGYSRKIRLTRSESYLKTLARKAAKRRAHMRSAIPIWFCRVECDAIYDKAHEMTLRTGIQYEVDHIVPMVSSKVCGLHWHGNMQVIPKSENASKGNRYWPDMP